MVSLLLSFGGIIVVVDVCIGPRHTSSLKIVGKLLLRFSYPQTLLVLVVAVVVPDLTARERDVKKWAGDSK